MSAYLCSDDLFDMLGSAMDRWNVTVYTDTASLVGRTAAAKMATILQAENVRSVNYKYNETDAPAYRFARVDYGQFGALDVLRAVSCLRYQSCECPDYAETLAARLLNALEQTAIRNLPGYDDTPREWTRERGEAIHRAAVVAFYEKQMTAMGAKL